MDSTSLTIGMMPVDVRAAASLGQGKYQVQNQSALRVRCWLRDTAPLDPEHDLLDHPDTAIVIMPWQDRTLEFETNSDRIYLAVVPLADIHRANIAIVSAR